MSASAAEVRRVICADGLRVTMHVEVRRGLLQGPDSERQDLPTGCRQRCSLVVPTVRAPRHLTEPSAKSAQKQATRRPEVDHLSNNGALNVLLDRAISGLPSGLPPDRTMVALFINFARLTDKALREYNAARAELLRYVEPRDGLRMSIYLRALDHLENCVSATHRAVLTHPHCRRTGSAAPGYS